MKVDDDDDAAAAAAADDDDDDADADNDDRRSRVFEKKIAPFRSFDFFPLPSDFNPM